jgi:ribosome-associated translation inhibitor RaiA
MTVEIRRQNIDLTDAERELLTERIRTALNRFERHVDDVVVTVADVNGPKAGPDKQCRIQVTVRGGRHLIVEETGVDLSAVATRAADRMANLVSRDHEKFNDYSHAAIK